MKRYLIEPRDGWLERIRRAGVVLGSQEPHTLWNEQYCIEMSMHDADALQAHAEDLYRAMVKLTDHVIEEEQHLSEFDFTIEEQRVIARSWERSDYIPTLFTRLDYRCDVPGVWRFDRVVSGPSEGLLETAVAQWDWLLGTAPWASQFNTISERLLEAWREYHLISRVVHFVYDSHDARDTAIAEYLWDSALSTGVSAVASSREELRLSADRSRLLDGRGNSIDVLVTADEQQVVDGVTLWQITDQVNGSPIEPHWKRLWQHPDWLPYCTRALHEHDVVFQLISQISCERDPMVCSIWVVAGQVSGIGFSTIVPSADGDTREFVPHLLS